MLCYAGRRHARCRSAAACPLHLLTPLPLSLPPVQVLGEQQQPVLAEQLFHWMRVKGRANEFRCGRQSFTCKMFWLPPGPDRPWYICCLLHWASLHCWPPTLPHTVAPSLVCIAALSSSARRAVLQGSPGAPSTRGALCGACHRQGPLWAAKRVRCCCCAFVALLYCIVGDGCTVERCFCTALAAPLQSHAARHSSSPCRSCAGALLPLNRRPPSSGSSPG